MGDELKPKLGIEVNMNTGLNAEEKNKRGLASKIDCVVSAVYNQGEPEQEKEKQELCVVEKQEYALALEIDQAVHTFHIPGEAENSELTAAEKNKRGLASKIDCVVSAVYNQGEPEQEEEKQELCVVEKQEYALALEIDQAVHTFHIPEEAENSELTAAEKNKPGFASKIDCVVFAVYNQGEPEQEEEKHELCVDEKQKSALVIDNHHAVPTFNIPRELIAAEEQEKLPWDLVQLILCMLPANKIGGHKLVCTQWRNLFIEQQFIDKHFSHPRSPSYFIHDSLYGQNKFFIVKRGNPAFVDRLLLPGSESEGTIFLAGSCQGVICFVRYTHEMNIILVNPSTKDILSIREEPFSKLVSLSCFGFGYNPSSKTFLLIRFFLYKNTYTFGQIYNFEDKDWEYLNQGAHFCFSTESRTCDAVVKGVPYFNVYNEKEEVHQLAWFNHETSEIVLESYDWSDDDCAVRLCELHEGQLSAMITDLVTDERSIWTRKDIGGWDNAFIVDMDLLDHMGPFIDIVWDEFVLYGENDLIFAKSANLNEFDSVEGVEGGWNQIHGVITFRESIVKLPKCQEAMREAVKDVNELSE
ncbi:hypothetical protein CASFOL_006092 [Castilleja foliolosa]|uniref:F-box associated beta-propeller type 1 domain-containing protein n=1 Tax=Castilleja foliolosa TaxID=1961234 RepID=A0ABD3E9B1_9LAMI